MQLGPGADMNVDQHLDKNQVLHRLARLYHGMGAFRSVELNDELRTGPGLRDQFRYFDCHDL